MEGCKCKQENGGQDHGQLHKVCLENDRLSVEVKLHGAELCSIINKANGKQYLWSGDPKFWGRTSPVLFPFVGGLRNKEYHYNGKCYPMSQHGFARDTDFELIEQKESEAWFRMSDTEETYEKYPFHFHLDIGYRLENNQVTVMWRVENTDHKNKLHFSIGAHPAFACPLNAGEERSEYFLQFQDGNGNDLDRVDCRGLGSEGLVISDMTTYQTPEGMCRIEEKLFEGDTMILENNQAKEISLLDPAKKPYVTVCFEAPLAGIWTPAKKNDPFVCIEPWYGRCDSAAFDGDLTTREWANELEPGEIFEANYRIIIEKQMI